MNNYEGFTLVELLILIAIVGILSSLGFTAYQGYVFKTNVASCLAETKSYANLVYYNLDEQINVDTLPQPNAPSCDSITDASTWSSSTQSLSIQATSKKATAVNIECNLAESASCKVI